MSAELVRVTSNCEITPDELIEAMLFHENHRVESMDFSTEGRLSE
jgi:hypothetical protein